MTASPFLIPPAALAAHDLACIRGGRHVFSGVSFMLSPGAAIRLIGANGAGKSTLLRLLSGLLPKNAGHITWDNAPYDGHPSSILRYIGHSHALKPVLTVYENIWIWGKLWAPQRHTADIHADIEIALDRLDLQKLRSVPAKMLSAGQTRRTHLARLCVSRVPVWLLDEPTTALDKQSVANLEQLIADHQQAGGAVIVSTHGPIHLHADHTLDMNTFRHQNTPQNSADARAKADAFGWGDML